MRVIDDVQRAVIPLFLWVLLLAGCEKEKTERSSDVLSEVAVKVDPGISGAQLFASAINVSAARACLAPFDLVAPMLSIESTATAVTSAIVLAVDSSGSMAGAVGGEPKIAAARNAARSFLQDLPANARVGLVVFGHKGNNRPAGKPASCAGVDAAYPLGVADPERLQQSVSELVATGWTPLASAIRVAGAQFGREPDATDRVVYVVSDGAETCDGNPVAEAKRLRASGTRAVVNIIGFDVPATERAALREVAEAGGGEYLDAANGRAVLDRLRETSRLQIERSKAADRATEARYDNSGSVARAVQQTQTCLGKLQADESVAVQTLIAQPGIGPQVRSDARSLLHERHRQIRELSRSYARAARDRDTAQTARITSDLRNILSKDRSE